jgi:hypothetical protein
MGEKGWAVLLTVGERTNAWHVNVHDLQMRLHKNSKFSLKYQPAK